MGRVGLVATRGSAGRCRASLRPGATVAALLAACALAGSASALPPPAAHARAWLLENPATGQVLAAHDSRMRLPIASITKLMTLVVVLQHLDLADVVRVDPRAAAVGQESVYLQPGELISVGDLVKASLIQSANDAADALALATAPSFSAFASLMNAEARRLGLVDTHFVRPDGLDARGEYSSAHDVTLLARDAMKIPAVAATVAQETATISGGRVLHTWNDLLGVFPGVFGVKTGHTSAAGWCEVVAVRGDGTTLYLTILGSPSRSARDADLERLLAYGVAQYREVDVVTTGRDYANVALPYGRGELGLVASSELEAVTPVGALLTERVVAPISVSLPVRRGQEIGAVSVFEAGHLIGRRPLVASRSVAAPGLAGRIGWYASRTFHDLGRVLT